MSRGLGRIERTILALIEDKGAAKNVYTAETLAVAVYQPTKGAQRMPTQAERVAIARAMRSLAHKYPDRIMLKGGEGRPLWLERRSEPIRNHGSSFQTEPDSGQNLPGPRNAGHHSPD